MNDSMIKRCNNCGDWVYLTVNEIRFNYLPECKRCKSKRKVIHAAKSN